MNIKHMIGKRCSVNKRGFFDTIVIGVLEQDVLTEYLAVGDVRFLPVEAQSLGLQLVEQYNYADCISA